MAWETVRSSTSRSYRPDCEQAPPAVAAEPSAKQKLPGAGPARRGRCVLGGQYEDGDVVTGGDRTERDHKRVGPGGGCVGIATGCYGEPDIVAGVGRESDAGGW